MLGVGCFLLCSLAPLYADEATKIVKPAVAVAEEVPARQLSVIRVNVTNQPWEFSKPWGKRAPYTRRAIGAVITGGRVLVTAELVGNANYIEFEAADGGQKSPASIEAVDYECNLALLRADDPAILKDIKPLEITTAAVGDMLSIWQLENNGNLLITRGPMTTAEVSRYPADDSPFLIYRLTAPLQFRDNSFTLPVVNDGKLVGLLMRYNSSTNNADIIPAPIIERFLADAAAMPYEGFPRMGMTVAFTRDPQFRKYLGLDGTSGGIFVSDVLADGSAGKSGLEKGDVILKVDGLAIDQDGNYEDPDYGRIAVSHLFSTRHAVGEKVPFTVFRKGEIKDIPVTLDHRDVSTYVIEPYIVDRAPRFAIVGGFVLQELSRQYLKEWGNDWEKKAPNQFVYLDQMQHELFKGDGPKKIVFVSRVLPTGATVGYEDLGMLIVTKINDVALQSLSDVPAALAKSNDGLHKVEFDGEPTTIYLDAKAVSEEGEALRKKYRLPTLQHLE